MMAHPTFKLARGLQRVAEGIGKARQGDNVAAQRLDRQGHGTEVDALDLHIHSTGSELASSLLMDLSWTGMELGNLDAPDLSTFIQVRHTKHQFGGLTVQVSERCASGPTDDPNHAFMLARGTLEDGYEFPGWLWGYEAQDMRFWRADFGRPCFCVPTGPLRPLATLIQLAHEHRLPAIL